MLLFVLAVLAFSIMGLIYGSITEKNLISGRHYWTNKPFDEVMKKKEVKRKEKEEYQNFKKEYKEVIKNILKD
ncbi:MAG: hypothetical protein V2I33_13015 [Kangiellaceae bacterium]|jgi:hypothetical protein|nr:hypothetical protein [Kangiellaceae bacterium]